MILLSAAHQDGSVKATFTLPAGSTDQRVAVVGEFVAPEPEPGHDASRPQLGPARAAGPGHGEDAVLEATRALDQVLHRLFAAGLVLRRGSAESGGMTAEQRDGALAELDAARRELSVAHLSLGGPPGRGTA